MRAMIFVVLALLSYSGALTGGEWRAVSEIKLDHLESDAFDIRAIDGSTVYLALGRNGIVRLSAKSSKVERHVEKPAEEGGFFFAARLGASPTRLAVASPFGAFAWRGLPEGKTGTLPFALVMDVDVQGDRIVVLGADTDDTGTWAADGGLAWIGTMEGEKLELSLLALSDKGRGSQSVARCHFLESGAVRFLPDGSILVVPGVESGVYLYDRRARLIRTWQTEPLGILDDCPFDAEQTSQMAGDPAARWAWLNRFRTVEDIVPAAGEPALLVRSVMKGRTSWSLTTLLADGKTRNQTLPVTQDGERWHARADIYEGRLMLLLFEYALPGEKATPPRLVILEPK